MNERRIAIFIILIILVVNIMMVGSSLRSRQNENCGAIINTDKRDNCWHALAHQTLDRKICENISNNETKGHCFEHIPKK